MNRRQLQRNERCNAIADVIMEMLDSGPMTRKELFRHVHESPTRVGITEFVRELTTMRRCGIVHFSGAVEPSQLIELTPEWR